MLGCSILRDKSHGVPSWCEQLLREMLYDGVIKIEPLRGVDTGEAMVSPPRAKLTKQKMTVADMVDSLAVEVYIIDNHKITLVPLVVDFAFHTT